jgi:hypothetical protein
MESEKEEGRESTKALVILFPNHLGPTEINPKTIQYCPERAV